MDRVNNLLNIWKKHTEFDEECQKELSLYSDNESLAFDSFYKDLAFGTAGVRGIMGAGTNRMNIYTLGKVIKGLSVYLLNKFDNPKVVIGYDVRNNSKKFAELAALILKDSGIDVLVFSDLTPVSLVSYGIKYMNCDSGMILTASHNPREFNGCKVFNEFGHQIVGSESDEISSYIDRVDMFSDLDFEDLYNRINSEDILDEVKLVPDSCYEDYIDDIKKLSLTDEGVKDVKILFSPLNGVGRRPVSDIFDYIGVKYKLVDEQTFPDGDFETCPYPNPEKKEAYRLALEYAKEYRPDLILLTDPDCDRVGLMVENKGDYRLLNGDEVSILLFDFICNMREIPEKAYMLRSIVSNYLVDRIAEKFNISVIKTLTGFKNMGLVMKEKEDVGLESTFVFAFEESIGYLPGTFAKDKDGVSISMLVAQMVGYYREKGLNLLDRLDLIYQEYGYQLCNHLEFNLKGSAGKVVIDKIMAEFRENPMSKILDSEVVEIEDYLIQKRLDLRSSKEIQLSTDKSNVLIFTSEHGDRVAMRPSGTEPKLKIYIFTNEKTGEAVYKKRDILLDEIDKKVNSLIERFSNE